MSALKGIADELAEAVDVADVPLADAALTRFSRPARDSHVRKRAASGRSESCEKGASGRSTLNLAPSKPPNPDRISWSLPPSTLRTWPVTNEASSDAMKTIALATSSERPRRSIGTVVARARLVLRRAA